MDRYSRLLGCLLGTALGDAVGLKREGLSRDRSAKMYGSHALTPHLCLGLSFCSDDTEHTQMVGRSIVASGGNTSIFQREFSRQLRQWLLTVPAGIGFATLKSCLRLAIGIPPEKSGVWSAGNGPAMRSAIIGVWASSETQVKQLVQCSSKITHRDPRAEEGALLVAKAARLSESTTRCDPVDFLAQSVYEIDGDELREEIQQVVAALKCDVEPRTFADSRGWSHGVSGYINHTVPAALYCWAHSPDDFRRCVEQAVLLGGDSDSVAAIAGAVCGANLGHEKLPADWIAEINEWPRGKQWMNELARKLSDAVDGEPSSDVPTMHWPATLLRNLIFASLVLSLGLRRLFPPY